jgi:hypothetical protein
MGAWILKKSDSPIGESESKGHAIPWLSMIFIADCFDFAHFAVNCIDPAKAKALGDRVLPRINSLCPTRGFAV